MAETTYDFILWVFTNDEFPVMARYFFIVNGQRAVLVASNTIRAIGLQEFSLCQKQWDTSCCYRRVLLSEVSSPSRSDSKGPFMSHMQGYCERTRNAVSQTRWLIMLDEGEISQFPTLSLRFVTDLMSFNSKDSRVINSQYCDIPYLEWDLQRGFICIMGVWLR